MLLWGRVHVVVSTYEQGPRGMMPRAGRVFNTPSVLDGSQLEGLAADVLHHWFEEADDRRRGGMFVLKSKPRRVRLGLEMIGVSIARA